MRWPPKRNGPRSCEPAQTSNQGRARNLPETSLHPTSLRLTTRPPTAPPACVTVGTREALHGVVNHPPLVGKVGVAGSIPARGSTKPMTSANAGHLRVRGRWGGAYTGWSTLPLSTVSVHGPACPKPPPSPPPAAPPPARPPPPP